MSYITHSQWYARVFVAFRVLEIDKEGAPPYIVVANIDPNDAEAWYVVGAFDRAPSQNECDIITQQVFAAAVRGELPADAVPIHEWAEQHGFTDEELGDVADGTGLLGDLASAITDTMLESVYDY